MIGYVGFSGEGVYMGEDLTPGEPCGPHTTSWRAGGDPRRQVVWGLHSPLRLSFGVRVRDGNIWTGFFVNEVFMDERVTPGEACGPHTMCSRAGKWGRAARWCGGFTAPSVSPLNSVYVTTK